MPHYPFYVVYTALIFCFAVACNNGSGQSASQPAQTQSAVTQESSTEPATTGSAPQGGMDIQEQAESTPSVNTGAAAGVSWTVPGRWPIQPRRTMRVATYLIPMAAGDSEDGECAVFFFGQGQGGSVDLNLQRWRDQFETDAGGPSELAQRQFQVNDISVTSVSLAGTYLASMGPMFQAGAARKPGYKMLGAIIEAPVGNVFIKLTGPEKTVLDAEQEFQELLNSITK